MSGFVENIHIKFLKFGPRFRGSINRTFDPLGFVERKLGATMRLHLVEFHRPILQLTVSRASKRRNIKGTSAEVANDD